VEKVIPIGYLCERCHFAKIKNALYRDVMMVELRWDHDAIGESDFLLYYSHSLLLSSGNSAESNCFDFNCFENVAVRLRG